MPRKTKRKTVAKGIYRDATSFEVRVVVAEVAYSKRYPIDTPLDELKRERLRLEARAKTIKPRAIRHTLAADVPKYLKLHAHQKSYKNKRAMLNHWINHRVGGRRLGDTPRHRITPQDVRQTRVDWLTAGIAPKTVNHRVDVLRHLYAILDGKTAYCPCADIDALDVHKTPIQRVSDETILKVDAELQRREKHPPGRPYDGQKTRARFRVLVSTGKRPSELIRTQPSDVDLQHRVWAVRDGKGGWSPGLYLNDDMLAAWKLFIAANAWGHYNTGSFAVAIRNAGWPDGVRPYQARHTTWITARERGVDMGSIQQGAGHKSMSTTRQHYTGVLNSEMQRMSEALDGRFKGFPDVRDESGTDGK